jgi:hypothetical protein
VNADQLIVTKMFRVSAIAFTARWTTPRAFVDSAILGVGHLSHHCVPHWREASAEIFLTGVVRRR